jgi:predicted metal-dependent enzyme (double-stranded beta helix superfamily)
MPNRKSRVLEEIKELLKSLDNKLDKLLERQVSEELGLGPRHKELLRQLVKRDARTKTPSRLAKSEPHFGRAAYRPIESEFRLGVYRQSFVPGTFVSLPDHLRQTMQAIATFGEATALQVSGKTGRSRAAESDYLNQLVDRGFLKKIRRGREIVFQVFSLHTLCPMCGTRVPLNVRFCSHCGAALCRHEQRL